MSPSTRGIEYALAALWLWSGLQPPLSGWDASIALLQRLPLPAAWAAPLFLAACGLDIAFGLLTLWRPAAPYGWPRPPPSPATAWRWRSGCRKTGCIRSRPSEKPAHPGHAAMAGRPPGDFQMNDYLIVKTLHILSATLMVGTGFGSAFYMFFANRGRQSAAQAEVARLVVRADWWFTTPAVIFQPLSGLWLARQAGWPLSSGWLLASIGLFLFAGLCWLPVLRLQTRMATMARAAVAADQPLPARYWRYARYWEYLGYPAFCAMLAVYFLMVLKPA